MKPTHKTTFPQPAQADVSEDTILELHALVRGMVQKRLAETEETTVPASNIAMLGQFIRTLARAS